MCCDWLSRRGRQGQVFFAAQVEIRIEERILVKDAAPPAAKQSLFGFFLAPPCAARASGGAFEVEKLGVGSPDDAVTGFDQTEAEVDIAVAHRESGIEATDFA